MLLITRIARTMLVPVLVTLALPGLAGAQLTKAGVVTTLQGTATVARAAAPQPVPLKFKDTVFVQDRITTGDDSVARILLGGKAIVTVRERSVLTITEVPGTSTIDLGIGKIALAVVKERMKSGETIEIRTPNAVAGIRGTVVITEVDQKTAQLGAGAAAFTSRFTVLQGIVAVSQYNPLTRQLGPTVNLGALQTTGITGSAAPRPPVTITPEAARQLASEYKTTIKEAPPAANAAVTNSQVQQAVNYVGAVVNPKANADTRAREGESQGQRRSDDASAGAAGTAPGTATGTSSGSTPGTGNSAPASSGTAPGGTGGSSGPSLGRGEASGRSEGGERERGDTGQNSGRTSGSPVAPTPPPGPAPVVTNVAPPPAPVPSLPVAVTPPPVVAAPVVVVAPPVIQITPPPVTVAPPALVAPRIVAPTIVLPPTIKLPSGDDLKKRQRQEDENRHRNKR